MRRYGRERRSVLRGANASPHCRPRRRPPRKKTFWDSLEPPERETARQGSVVALRVIVTPPPEV